jgi:hypothetical protein
MPSCDWRMLPVPTILPKFAELVAVVGFGRFTRLNAFVSSARTSE